MGRLKIGTECTQGDPEEKKVKVKTRRTKETSSNKMCVFDLKNRELHNVASGQKLQKYGS
jgi:hypothetical protein